MAKMTYGQLQGVIANDNTNIDNMIRGFINESANASVVAIYDDSLVLVDTVTEEFYTAKYHYNPDTLSVILEDYEHIELEEDNVADFKSAVKDYLISEESDSKELVDSYLNTLNKSKIALNTIVSEAIADKDYSNVADFEELSFINEEFEDLRKSEFFEAYQERLITHPLNKVLFLDWETPVAFTLLETTEPKAYINSKSKDKALKSCASKDWKKKMCTCARKFVEDVEEGGDMLLEMFNDNMSLFSLNSTEFKEAVSKAIMLDPQLNGNYKQISEAIVHFVHNDDGFKYLAETIDIDDNSDTPEAQAPEEGGEEKKDGESEDKPEEKKEDDKAVELSPEDKKKLTDALDTVIEKATDENIKKMAQELRDKFKDEDLGTKPNDVKEAVQFLSF